MPETMACVIISDRVQELILRNNNNFKRKINDFWNHEPGYEYQRRIIMKYKNGDIPSIISHLTASIRNNFNKKRKPQLRSLKISYNYPDISSERLSNRKDGHGDGDQELIFSSLAETQSYEKYPVILSSFAHEENYATEAYSGHPVLIQKRKRLFFMEMKENSF